jgi:hypothetical protein
MPRVLAGRALDLDHVGAHVSEHLRAERPGDEAREVQHAYAVERSGHGPDGTD